MTISPLFSISSFIFMLPVFTRIFYNTAYNQLKQIPVLIILSGIFIGFVIKFSKKYPIKLKYPRFFWIINLYSFWIIFASLFAISKNSFFIGFLIFFELSLTYILITNLYSIYDTNLLLCILKTICLSGVLYSVLGLIFLKMGREIKILGIHKFTYSLLSEGIIRLTSIFPNANMFGMILFFSISSTVILIFSTKKTAGKGLYLVCLMVMLISLFYSFSRSSILAVFVFLVVFLLLSFSPKKIVLVIFTVSVIVGALVIKIPTKLYKALVLRGTAGRVFLWVKAIEIFKSHPLTGTGLGTWFIVSGEILRSHNTFLTTLVEEGLPGILIIGIFYTYLAIVFLRKREKKIRKSHYHFVNGAFSIIMGSIVQQLFESYTLGFGGPEFTSYYFLIFTYLLISMLLGRHSADE